MVQSGSNCKESDRFPGHQWSKVAPTAGKVTVSGSLWGTWGSLGGPWGSPKGPWGVPQGPLGNTWRSLGGPWWAVGGHPRDPRLIWTVKTQCFFFYERDVSSLFDLFAKVGPKSGHLGPSKTMIFNETSIKFCTFSRFAVLKN